MCYYRRTVFACNHAHYTSLHTFCEAEERRRASLPGTRHMPSYPYPHPHPRGRGGALDGTTTTTTTTAAAAARCEEQRPCALASRRVTHECAACADRRARLDRVARRTKAELAALRERLGRLALAGPPRVAGKDADGAAGEGEGEGGDGKVDGEKAERDEGGEKDEAHEHEPQKEGARKEEESREEKCETKVVPDERNEEAREDASLDAEDNSEIMGSDKMEELFLAKNGAALEAEVEKAKDRLCRLVEQQEQLDKDNAARVANEEG